MVRRSVANNLNDVSIEFALRSRSRSAQDLLVDLAVHFVKANRRPSPKAFKLKRLALPPRGRVEFSTAISLAVHTTRKPQPGRHTVDVIVNGKAPRWCLSGRARD